MSTKTISPEAAQRKEWKAELKTITQNRGKVLKDFRDEEKRLLSVWRASKKAEADALAKLDRFRKHRPAKEGTALKAFDTRIAILKGRIGV